MAAVRTFGVLAGAYPRGQRARAFLLHAAEVDSSGYPVRVLCSRVAVDNLCPDGYTDADLARVPTCDACRRRDPRIRATPAVDPCPMHPEFRYHECPKPHGF